MATAPIRPLAWEPPYAMGAALEKTEKEKKKNVFLFFKLQGLGMEENADVISACGMGIRKDTCPIPS